jgi:hypothetical protein
MILELDEREVELLLASLRSRIDDLTWELSRTEQRALQHELAQLVARLELVATRIEAQRRLPSELGAASDR